MLSDLDKTIEALLKQEGGLGKPQDASAGEASAAGGATNDEILSRIEISFAIPNREWSHNLGTTMTINCYLFDIHERRLLREEGRWFEDEGRGMRMPTRRQPPLFFEMTYLITAWCEHVEDEHLLLWRVLETLMDHPVLPQQHLQGALKTHEWPIHTAVAQLEGVLKSPGEFWTALENQIKPSLTYTVTLGRQRRPAPTEPAIAPPVKQAGTSIGWRLSEVFTLPAETRVAGVTVQVKDRNAQSITAADGRFRFDGLTPGHYTLEAAIDGRTYSAEVDVQPGETIKLTYHDAPIGGSNGAKQ